MTDSLPAAWIVYHTGLDSCILVVLEWYFLLCIQLAGNDGVELSISHGR